MEKKSITEKSFGRDEVWAVPALGGNSSHVARSGYVIPSSDGASIFYRKTGNPEIFRAAKSGIGEELVYKPEGIGLYFFPNLLFPGDNDLLAAGYQSHSPNFRFYRINRASHEGFIWWVAPGIGLTSCGTNQAKPCYSAA